MFYCFVEGNEIGYLAEENSKQSVEAVAWFLLTAYYKLLKEKWFEDGITK